MKTLLFIILATGLLFWQNSCKAPGTSLSATEKEGPLKARVFMAPFAEDSEGGKAGSCLEKLQEALAMHKLSFLEWPENPEALTDIREEGSCWSDSLMISRLSWTAKGDSLFVSYSGYKGVSEFPDSAGQEGEFILITDQETIRVSDFSYREN